MNENKNFQKIADSIQNEASLKSKEDPSNLTPFILYDPNEFLKKPHKNFTRISNSNKQSEESEPELSNWKDRKDLEQNEEKPKNAANEEEDKDEVQESEKNVRNGAESSSESKKKLSTERETSSQITAQPQIAKEKLPDHKHDLITSFDLLLPLDYQGHQSNSSFLFANQDESKEPGKTSFSPSTGNENLPDPKYDLVASLELPLPSDHQVHHSSSFFIRGNQDESKEPAKSRIPSGLGTQTHITAPHHSKSRGNLRVSFIINQLPPSTPKSSLPLPSSSFFLKPAPTVAPSQDDHQDALNARIFTIISQFYLVTKFVRVLRNSTIYKSPKYLKKDNFSLINDLSFFLEGWKKNYNIYATGHSKQHNLAFLAVQRALGRWKLIKGIGKMLERMNVVFDPINPLRIAWDCIQMGLLVCFFMLIPVQIGFGVDLAEELGSFKNISFYLFLIDFLVNLNTAYYEKGELIKRRPRIVQHYLSQNLLKDLISFVYFSSYFTMQQTTNSSPSFLQIELSLLPTSIQDCLPLIFYLRLFTLRKILIRIQEYLFIEEKAYNRLSLIKLIVSIFFFSHVLACIWHYIGSLKQNNWMTELDIAQLSWVSRYLYSYYYVVVVMNTVGFGDIVPKNDLERVVAILFIYVACGMFAYTINSIGVIVQDLNKRNKEFNRSVSLVNGYMKQKKINFNLRIRVQKYLEYIWLEKSGQNEEETQKIINKLSKSLKEELLLSANGVIFKNLPLFYMNFSEETLRRVVYQIKEVSLVPGDMLFDRDDVGEEKALYIVKKGEVDMMGEGMHVIRKIREGGVCGEVSFFSGRSRECYARSSTFTSLYVLHREDFLNIISSNAQDYERFCEIKDKINVYENVEDLYIRCSSCSREDHGVLFCPLLHLTLEKQRIIARFTYSEEQERGEGNRRNIRFYAKKSFKSNSRAAILINRNFKEKEKHTKEEEEEDCSEMEEESHLSSAFDDDPRTSKKSLNFISENSNCNIISNENLLLKPKTLNRANSIVSEMDRKGSLAFLDEGGEGGVGGGEEGGGGGGVGLGVGVAVGIGGVGGGGGVDKQWMTNYTKRTSVIAGPERQGTTNNTKHSSRIHTTLINNLEKLLLNVPLARRTPGIVQMSFDDSFGSFNEVSKNYRCYFPHNNIESIVNFIKRFCEFKQRQKKRVSSMIPNDFAGKGSRMVGGMRILEGGGMRTERGIKRMEEEGRTDEVVQRRKRKREKRREEVKGKKEGVKKSFFSAHFEREREMMKHNGIIDRERIVALLRRLERKRKGWLERWCCFWRYFWK